MRTKGTDVISLVGRLRSEHLASDLKSVLDRDTVIVIDDVGARRPRKVMLCFILILRRKYTRNVRLSGIWESNLQKSIGV